MEDLKEKYKEMKELGLTEDFLNENILGRGLKVFINHKPTKVFMELKIDPDTVYLGSNDL